jgi:triacylglycerol lipase
MSVAQHIFLIHGLGRRPRSLAPVARLLKREGFEVSNWGYPSLRQALEEVAQDFRTAYLRQAQTVDQIHVVTHSLGGIVLRCALAQGELPKLGRIVMLAPPNQGSSLARVLSRNRLIGMLLGPAAPVLSDPTKLAALCCEPCVPTCVIAGSRARDMRNPVSLISRFLLSKASDGTVTIDETRLANMARFQVIDACHTWIMNHPQAQQELLAFLKPSEPPAPSPKPEHKNRATQQD